MSIYEIKCIAISAICAAAVLYYAYYSFIIKPIKDEIKEAAKNPKGKYANLNPSADEYPIIGEGTE